MLGAAEAAAEAERQTAAAAAAEAARRRADAENAVKLRAEIRDRLNAALPTRESDRGLVSEIGGVQFATGTVQSQQLGARIARAVLGNSRVVPRLALHRRGAHGQYGQPRRQHRVVAATRHRGPRLSDRTGHGSLEHRRRRLGLVAPDGGQRQRARDAPAIAASKSSCRAGRWKPAARRPRDSVRSSASAAAINGHGRLGHRDQPTPVRRKSDRR